MKILVFGSKGMVGSSIFEHLKLNFKDYKIVGSSREDTDLSSIEQTKKLIINESPDLIINAAAKVGGIVANNTFRSEFILNNLKISMNIFESIINFPEIKVINLGSSCIYPLNAENPIGEEALLTGKLEPTNSPYAIAKLASIEIGDTLRKQFGHKVLDLMPTNLYGPNDNFDFESSHVIPGLISRMHFAKISDHKEFSVWGSGKPLREFLYVEDLADAICFFIKNEIYDGMFNVGSGEEVSIASLVDLIKKTIGFEGKVFFDKTKPDGNPRKLLNSSKIFDLGWKPETNLNNGLQKTYKWYLNKNI